MEESTSILHDPVMLTILIIIGGCIFFTVGRMIILWFYKIDERIKQQEETNSLLRDIKKSLDQK